MTTMNQFIAAFDKPMPPVSGAARRYDGIQELSPHHANIVHAFISVTAKVMRSMGPPIASPSDTRVGLAFSAVHIAGSSTLRRTQYA